eukprot:1187406-Rhodomonas_salina.1
MDVQRHFLEFCENTTVKSMFKGLSMPIFLGSAIVWNPVSGMSFHDLADMGLESLHSNEARKRRAQAGQDAEEVDGRDLAPPSRMMRMMMDFQTECPICMEDAIELKEFYVCFKCLRVICHRCHHGLLAKQTSATAVPCPFLCPASLIAI